METILRRIILASIFIVPFLVFLVPDSMFFPFITGKNFGFRMLVEVMVFSWMPLAYYRAEYRPKFSWIMAVLVFFVSVIFLADIFGANPYRSFWSNYERMEGFVGLVHLFGYFVVAGSVLSTEKLWMRFFRTITFASLLMVLYGMCQLSGSASCPINQSSTRLDGTLGNAAYLAVFMLFSIAFTAILLAKHRGTAFMKWVYGVLIFFQALILYYTQTRGVIIGLVIGILFSSALILISNKKNRRIRNGMFGVLGALILIVSSIAVFRNSAFVKENEALNRMASFSLTEALNNPRFMVWGMAMDGFRERPILGWGQENFNLVFNKYYDPKMYRQEQWFDRAHNIFFDWLIAGGILGLLGYLLLFASAFLFVWKREESGEMAGETRMARWWNTVKGYFSGEREQRAIEASIWSGLLIAYFINNIFVFDNLFSYILFFTLLAYLHHLDAEGRKRYVNKPSEKKTPVKAGTEVPFIAVAVSSALIGIAALYFVNLKPLFANQALIDGIRARGNTFTQENFDAFKKAADYNTFGNGEVREQIVQSAIQLRSVPVDDKLKQATFELARDQMLLQMEDAPGDARYEMFAGMLFFRYGMNNEAISHFERAHAFSPAKQPIASNLILGYINAGKTNEAYDIAKKIYELEPSNQESGKFYAIAAFYTGKEQLAKEVLVKTFGTEMYYDEMLINVYAELRKFDTVVKILHMKLSEKDDPQLRLRLAAAYLEMGKKTESLAEIQKIIDVHPDFREQGEFYMNQIRAGKKP